MTSQPATSGGIGYVYPTITVDGGGTPESPWVVSLDENWAAEVARTGWTPMEDYDPNAAFGIVSTSIQPVYAKYHRMSGGMVGNSFSKPFTSIPSSAGANAFAIS